MDEDPDSSMVKMESDQKINPWNVNSIDEFLYYNCPECDFKVKDGDSFGMSLVILYHLKEQKKSISVWNFKYEISSYDYKSFWEN